MIRMRSGATQKRIRNGVVFYPVPNSVSSGRGESIADWDFSKRAVNDQDVPPSELGTVP